VPTIAPHGEFDDVIPAHTSSGHAKHFTGRYERRLLPVGHNPPQEAPAAFAQAILDLAG
jgi:pimeloyl-ACP methyl ester carboxylesterase